MVEKIKTLEELATVLDKELKNKQASLWSILMEFLKSHIQMT